MLALSHCNPWDGMPGSKLWREEEEQSLNFPSDQEVVIGGDDELLIRASSHADRHTAEGMGKYI